MTHTSLDYTLLRINGPQARAFLQGQLSCDLNLVTEKTMQPGFLCNLKGRVLAYVDVLFWGGALYCCFPSNMLPIILKALKVVAQLSRVQLEPVANIYCFGIQSPSEPKLEIPIPDAPYAFTSSAEMACYKLTQNLIILLSKTQTPSSSDSTSWHQAKIEQSLPDIYPETSGQFLPHQLGLDKPPFVSFDKGCYKGQEIIARMYYRGKNKYQIKTGCYESKQPLHPGMPIVKEDQLLGEIIDVVYVGKDNYSLIASILQSESASLAGFLKANF